MKCKELFLVFNINLLQGHKNGNSNSFQKSLKFKVEEMIPTLEDFIYALIFAPCILEDFVRLRTKSCISLVF